MSFMGNAVMAVLRFADKFHNKAITDPKQYLRIAQQKNARHTFHKVRGHSALYDYYKFNDCPVILIHSKKTVHRKDKAILYLHGGITNEWETELSVAKGYASRTGIDVWYPLFPSITQAAASDIVEIIFNVYKAVIKRYGAQNTALIGTSFGGTFGFGLICRINMENKCVGKETNLIPMPSLYIANSPGGVPRTKEDWMEMEKMSVYDPLIHVSAVRNIIPMQHLIKADIPEYANSPAYGDLTDVPETYVYYAEETLAGNHLAYERGYEKYQAGSKMHLHIQPGMMHGYSCLPVFKESKAAYNEQIDLLKHL